MKIRKLQQFGSTTLARTRRDLMLVEVEFVVLWMKHLFSVEVLEYLSEGFLLCARNILYIGQRASLGVLHFVDDADVSKQLSQHVANVRNL